MVGEDEQLGPKPDDNPKALGEWTSQEMDEFAKSFSRDNFELVKPKEAEEEGYVKVTVPASVEPMARGLIAAEWRMVEALDSPIDKISQERVSQRIGSTANLANFSEEEEAELINKFGQFFDVVAARAGQPDPALEEMKQGIRREAHKMVAKSFQILLQLANLVSWDDYIKQLSEQYPGDEAPQEVIDRLTSEHNDYQEMRKLLNRDPQAGETPKFLLVSSTGRQIFKSLPEINIS